MVFEVFRLPCILISELNQLRCCSKGSEPKWGKNGHLRISYCSSAVERADKTIEKMRRESDWEETFQLEAGTERKFMKFLIKGATT